MSSNQSAPAPSRRALVITAGALAVVIVAAAIAFAVWRGAGHSTKSTSSPPACGSSGCAMVSFNRTLPPVTVFYGASCSGVYGKWFFNAVEGGPNDSLRPSYALSWSFAAGSTAAKPSGRIVTQTTASTQATLALSDGTLTITGTRKPNVRVAATGTLVVEVSGTATAPTLKFTETGLAKAESALGLVSPFDVGGQPLIVPVKTVKTMSNC